MLVENGMGATEAIERLGISSAHFYAMKALRESGNSALHEHVLKGHEAPITAAKRVKSAAAAITAIKRCSVLERELVRLATGMTSDPVTMLLNLGADQLVATSSALGLDWVWDHMLAAAMPAEAATESNSNSSE